MPMETQAPAVPILARHVFRAGIGEPERMYTLLPDRLVVESPAHPPMWYDLAELRRVQLKYDRGKARQYWFTIIDTDRGQLRIRHSHFAGLANVEDRRATYTPFVLQLLAQLERYPNVQMTSGSMFSFVGLLLLIPLIVIIGAFALSIGRTDAVIVTGVMMLVLLLNLGKYRPRTITAAAPPRGLLPL